MYGGLRGVFGSLFPSFAFNSRKSQIRFVIFSSRPGGPRCLKYQNVPELQSFWAIGKPRERFQSWVIRVYFLTVPDDHSSLLTSDLIFPTLWKKGRMGICQCVANEFIPRGLSTCTLLFQTLKKRCSPFFWKKKERTLLENDSFLDNSRRPWPLDGVSVAVSLLCFDWVSGAGQHTYLHILDHFPFSFYHR